MIFAFDVEGIQCRSGDIRIIQIQADDSTDFFLPRDLIFLLRYWIDSINTSNRPKKENPMKTPNVPPTFPIISGMVIFASFVTVKTLDSSKLMWTSEVFLSLGDKNLFWVSKSPK